ncbi:MAG TPA: nucleotidyltransferase family protein [Candidatus Ozemobacteraceae bacterium]|nr:nucleotidyltransferase family protein [Candidatus Ozemobacteraceae bacterium]
MDIPRLPPLLERVLLDAGSSLLDTLRAIDDSALEIALIVDDGRRLLGTVTDGDIRRGLLRGTPLDAPVSLLMNPKPVTAAASTPDDELLYLMSQRSIKHLPLVDAHNRVMGLKRLQDLIAKRPRPNWAVVMAGGRGKRLGVLTDTTPKPLLPVGDQPLLGTIIRQIQRSGINTIFVTVHYRAGMIISYLRSLAAEGLDLRIIEERESLGTAGGLRLLPEIPGHPVLLMNGDLLTSVNLGNLLEYHAASGRRLTVCTREFNFQIPYGVLSMNGAALAGIEEKPSQKLVINAGIYVLEPDVIRTISGEGPIDMPDVIRHALQDPAGVGCFPLSEFWLDIGSPSEYQRAQTEYAARFSPSPGA